MALCMNWGCIDISSTQQGSYCMASVHELGVYRYLINTAGELLYGLVHELGVYRYLINTAGELLYGLVHELGVYRYLINTAGELLYGLVHELGVYRYPFQFRSKSRPSRFLIFGAAGHVIRIFQAMNVTSPEYLSG